MDRELQAEQAHVDLAYRRLQELREETERLLRSVIDQGRGGTHQFREERDVIVRTSLARLDQLDIGDQALCFGRIDRRADEGHAEVFHIGRLGVSGDGVEPLVVDWRAPVAEPFYRATGREPMGLLLRRHLAAQGRRIVGIEDERFAPGGPSSRRGVSPTGEGVPGSVGDGDDADTALGGPGALLAALDQARTGSMRDIVATIQREQDEIIRAPLPGVLVVQGGPGTGKTAVALHRAAYLLYTHRFPLERQGVLVIGPNPLFLRYIEQVLPSLGESGVTLSTIDGLARPLTTRGEDGPAVARLKGEARMAKVVARAVRARQRPLRRDVEVPYGAMTLHLTAEASAAVVAAARRRPGTHNGRRRLVEQLVVRHLADEAERRMAHRRIPQPAERGPDASHGAGAMPLATVPGTRWGAMPSTAPFGLGGGAGMPGTGAAAVGTGTGTGTDANADATDGRGNGNGTRVDGDGGWVEGRSAPANDGEDPHGVQDDPVIDMVEFGRAVCAVPAVAEALDRMWPRLDAEELVHDLFGAAPLVALAAGGILSAAEQRLLVRPRSASLSDIPWTTADLALIDEARVWLGPRRSRPGDRDAGARTYGHIVVDEAQDLSPMQLRMVARRSLSGSITVVGDIGQATGPWAPPSWDDVTAHLPAQRPARKVELTVSYRTPAEVVEVAARVLAAAAPMLTPPTPVRRTGVAPRFVSVPGPAAWGAAGAPASEGTGAGSEGTGAGLVGAVVESVRQLAAEVAPGTVAVLAPASLVGELAVGLDAAGVAASDPRRDGLGTPLSLLPVDLANGLEFDAVVVVEPAEVVASSPQGLRSLYVALTRPTRRLTVVHALPLPAALLPERAEQPTPGS